MKKIFLFLLLGIFMISSVSAWEADNAISDYNSEEEIITFRNGCLFDIGWTCIGGEIGKVQLKTPKNFRVAAGYNYVWEMDVWVEDDYNDFLKGFEFEDMNNGKQKINREIDIKIFKGVEQISKPTYGCLEYGNTNGTNACIDYGITGSRLVEEDVWEKVTPADLKKSDGKVRLRGYTDVQVGDRIDWSPLIFGVRVSHDIWATWTAGLNVGAVLYQKLDEISGTVVTDSTGLNNGTADNADVFTSEVTGIINTGADFVNERTISVPNNASLNLGGANHTINFWINWDGEGVAYQSIISKGEAVGGVSTVEYQVGFDDNSRLRYSIFKIAGGDAWIVSVDTSASAFPTGTWTMVTVVADVSDDKVNFYINGSLTSSIATVLTDAPSSQALTIGSRQTSFMEGNLDEIVLYNRSLTPTEITQIYDAQKDGLESGQYRATFGPTISILSPENITYNETLTQLNYSVADGDSCWFSDDGGVSNSSAVAAGTNFTGLTSSPLLNEWTVYCNNSESTSLDTVLFFVNQSVLTELIFPLNNSNSTQTNQNFTVNSTPTNTNLTNVTLYVWHSNGTLFLTNTTTLSGDSEVQTNITSNLTQGIFLWNAETCGEDVSCSFAANNNTLEIHTTPSTVIIHFPNETINFFRVGNNLTLNWTISEPGQNLSEHVINCSYIYNGTEVGLNLSQCIEINETSFLYIDGVNNLTFKVLEEFGLMTTNVTSWGFTILEINQTYNNETIEGSAEDFSAVIRLGPGETISAVALVYNNSATAGVSSTIGDNITITLEGFIIPQVTTETNITFYWSVILTGGEIINLTSQNQTVKNMAVDNCSAFTNQILNISMVDEEKQTPLSNTTLEVAINLLSTDRTQTVVSLSGSFDDENPVGICLSENITNETMYSLDAILKYTAAGYAIEYYNIVDFSLNNDTKTLSITLYNLNASDSTDFQLTFNGEDFLPVEGALVFVERQYIAENTFKTVELPKTDSNGQTILHLVRNDIIYNIRIVKEGESLANFLNIIAFCQDFTIGDCTLPLNAQSNTTGIFNYDDEIGILYDSPPTYNATTNIVSFDFTSTSGATKIVKMNVERRDIFGNNSICDNTIVSTSGTVFCNIGVNLSDTTLFTTITIDGEKWIADTTQIDKTNFGSIGFVMWFILSIALLLMFAESKNGVMLSVAISYIGAVTLGLATGTITGVGSAGIWMLVITSIGIWKINKNRSS